MAVSLDEDIFTMSEPDISSEEPGIEMETLQSEEPGSHSGNPVQSVPRKPAAEQASDDPIVVMVAGLPRIGKSRALGHIFDVDFKHDDSLSSVTLTADSIEVVVDNRNIKVIDSPGLGAQDISTPRVLKDLKKAIGRSTFVVLFCISVSPGSSLTVADEHAMKALQNALGKDVWKRCVVLLTSCDALQNKVGSSKYDKMIHRHIEEINKLLQKVGSRFMSRAAVPEVKFQDKVPEDQEEVHDIVAIPVGYDETSQHATMDQTWRIRALLEITRKLETFQRIKLWEGIFLRRVYNQSAAGVSGVAVGSIAGAAIGGVVGGVIGIAAYGVGAVPGAAIGAAVGGSIGGTWGMSMSQVVYHLHAAQGNSQQKPTKKKVDKDDQSMSQSHQEDTDTPFRDGNGQRVSDAGETSDVEGRPANETMDDEGDLLEQGESTAITPSDPCNRDPCKRSK